MIGPDEKKWIRGMRQVEVVGESRLKLRRAVFDWKTEGGAHRHFYFDVQCVDTDGAVLALIDECLRRVGDLSGYTVYVRHAFTVHAGCAPVELTEESLANAIRMMRDSMRTRSEALRVVPTKVWMRPPVNAEHIRLVMYGDPLALVDAP